MFKVAENLKIKYQSMTQAPKCLSGVRALRVKDTKSFKQLWRKLGLPGTVLGPEWWRQEVGAR